MLPCDVHVVAHGYARAPLCSRYVLIEERAVSVKCLRAFARMRQPNISTRVILTTLFYPGNITSTKNGGQPHADHLHGFRGVQTHRFGSAGTSGSGGEGGFGCEWGSPAPGVRRYQRQARGFRSARYARGNFGTVGDRTNTRPAGRIPTRARPAEARGGGA